MERKGTSKPIHLKGHQRVLLWLLVCFVRIWSKTLRFHWGSDVQSFMDHSHKPLVVIAWHNRLFASPEFFRRYFKERKLATMISASSDGGWLAGFFQTLGILPVRGSRYGRGVQAFRELIAANHAGYDVGVTPDGSRGPIYDMKPGAVAVAMKTEAPIVLVSFNFASAWRLKSWDRFYLPKPFSRIEAKLVHIDNTEELDTNDPVVAAAYLKAKLDAITEDDLLDSLDA